MTRRSPEFIGPPHRGQGLEARGRESVTGRAQIDVSYRHPPLVGLEETYVPAGVRWWNERVGEFARSKENEVSEGWTRTLRWVLRRFPTHVWPKVGIRDPPTYPGAVEIRHVRALRESPAYAPKTRSQYLQALREFLRWSGSPHAEVRGIWTLDARPFKRRWLTKEQPVTLWQVCRDDEDRPMVASEGFKGLRRIELLRLRVRDVSLTLPRPSMMIHGKGRNGGKWREVPVTKHLYGVLVAATTGRSDDTRVYGFQRSDVDRRLDELRRLAGIPTRVSSHDLRRTFGRLAHGAGVSLVNLRLLYGHESVDMTAHYIGLDRDEMAAGLARFEDSLASASKAEALL